jgi:hypothetical protein
MAGPRFTTTRTIGGQRHQLGTTGAVAKGGGGLAAVPIGRIEHPPSVDEFGEYDPGDLVAIDTAIRHMPAVVAYCERKAEETIGQTGSGNFEVILSNNPSNTRARAYCAPANNEGIHEELSEHLLLKAAINMQGK